MRTKLFVALMMIANIAMGQKLLTLEDVMSGGNNWYNLQPENKYTAGGGNVPLETTADDLRELMTGRQLVSVERINEIVGEKVAHSGHNLLMPYAKRPVVQVRGAGRRLQVDWEQGKVVWSQPIPEGAEWQDFNQTSRNLAFTRLGNLYVMTAQGEELTVSKDGSTDGSNNIVYGQSVHRDEFGITKGICWSPDGERLAFYRMDQSMVTDYPQVNTFTRVAEYGPDKYPMLGMTSHKVTVGIYDCTTGKVTYLDAGDPTDRYFTNIAWSPDSKTVYMFELNRLQNDCMLASYDAVTGKKAEVIYRETSDKYVEPLHPIVFLPWDNNEFVMQSQKDGYNHLYLYNIRYKKWRQLTKGNFVVEDVYGFNTKNKSIIIASNEANPIQRNLYAVDVKTGKRKALDNSRGYHFASLSKSGQWLIDSYSEPTVPRNVDLVATATGKSSRLLTAKNPWDGYQQPIFENGSIKADDGVTDLYWRMVKPADFDPTKKYPTVVYVYGGPHAHNVDATWHWGSRSWETYMAQKGYVLFILDNRGSENRGIEFEQATWHKLGKVEMRDQMKGVEYLKSLPYVDEDRLGVHGWSYGGFMTISLMTNYPDVFKVGVAGGPVIDWKWYEVMYGERYMGTPVTNKEGIEASSLIPMAKNLKGKLQIIIGMNDPTVVPQHALSFIDACTEAGTQPDFFVYPGEGHNMMGHKSVHLHERITQYFEDYLKN